jgi:hypothetical protein
MKKKTLLFLLSSILAFTSIEAQNTWFEVKENPKGMYKNPASTFAGSLLVPGYGYFANDMMKEGFIAVGVEALLIGGGLATYYTGALTDKFAISMIAVGGGLQLISAIHATILSNKYNKKNGFAMKKTPKSTFEIETAGVGINLRLRF